MKMRRWTKAAAECYYRGCTCTGCVIPSMMSEKCQMKATVFELVRLFGIPVDLAPTEKECIRCGFIYPVTEFYVTKSGGYHGTCKKCRNEIVKDWKRKNYV